MKRRANMLMTAIVLALMGTALILGALAQMGAFK